MGLIPLPFSLRPAGDSRGPVSIKLGVRLDGGRVAGFKEGLKRKVFEENLKMSRIVVNLGGFVLLLDRPPPAL